MTTEVFKPEGREPFTVVVYSHGISSAAQERTDIKQVIPRDYLRLLAILVDAPIRGDRAFATRLRQDWDCGLQRGRTIQTRNKENTPRGTVSDSIGCVALSPTGDLDQS